MRTDADAIENQHIQSLQSIDRFLRDEIKVRGICEIVKSIRDHRQLAVDHFKWCDLDLANAERRFVIYGVRN
jgi:hypothetical protein